MPLSKDEMGGGTEANGRKSADFCSHCFKRGAFTEPDLTVAQMVEKVQGKLKEMHFPGFMARSFTKNIPSLKRWAQASAAKVG